MPFNLYLLYRNHKIKAIRLRFLISCTTQQLIHLSQLWVYASLPIRQNLVLWKLLLCRKVGVTRRGTYFVKQDYIRGQWRKVPSKEANRHFGRRPRRTRRMTQKNEISQHILLPLDIISFHGSFIISYIISYDVDLLYISLY
jgi:hypothetical protein